MANNQSRQMAWGLGEAPRDGAKGRGPLPQVKRARDGRGDVVEDMSAFKERIHIMIIENFIHLGETNWSDDGRKIIVSDVDINQMNVAEMHVEVGKLFGENLTIFGGGGGELVAKAVLTTTGFQVRFRDLRKRAKRDVQNNSHSSSHSNSSERRFRSSRRDESKVGDLVKINEIREIDLSRVKRPKLARSIAYSTSMVDMGGLVEKRRNVIWTKFMSDWDMVLLYTRNSSHFNRYLINVAPKYAPISSIYSELIRRFVERKKNAPIHVEVVKALGLKQPVKMDEFLRAFRYLNLATRKWYLYGAYRELHEVLTRVINGSPGEDLGGEFVVYRGVSSSRDLVRKRGLEVVHFNHFVSTSLDVEVSIDFADSWHRVLYMIFVPYRSKYLVIGENSIMNKEDEILLLDTTLFRVLSYGKDVMVKTPNRGEMKIEEFYQMRVM